MHTSKRKQLSESECDDSSSHSEENYDSSCGSEHEVSEVEVKTSKDIRGSFPISDQKSHPLKFICNALSDFTAEEDGDLSFVKGELLTITGIRRDGWWQAENNEEKQGLVPSTFLKVPEHMKTIVEGLMKSDRADKTQFWNHLRSSMRQAQALDVALFGFGAFPIGFRSSFLGQLLKKDKSFTTEAFLFPKLNETGLSFEDLHWEVPSLTLKPKVTVLQKIIHLVALRQIIQPPSGFVVTGRYVRTCLHDGNKVLSNIHTTKAKWDLKTPKIWTFNPKISMDGSCLEEGQIFIRSDKSFATLGILFELCVTYIKGNSTEVSEMSCGWAFMRLLNDSGLPVKSRTKILKVHDSMPFASHLDSSSGNIGSLKQFINRSKLPRMVVSISNPKRSSGQHICYLPSTLIGSVSSIPLLALYRKVISDDLLERTSFDSAELIESPFLTNFPRVFDEPDLADVFRKSWAERLKSDKGHDIRKENFKKIAFRSLFMETVFLLLNCCSLPSFAVGNSETEQERKSEIARIIHLIHEKDHGSEALSAEVEYKPISIKQLSTRITHQFQRDTYHHVVSS